MEYRIEVVFDIHYGSVMAMDWTHVEIIIHAENEEDAKELANKQARSVQA